MESEADELTPAERVYAEYRDRLDRGGAESFEAFCSAHPELDAALRELHANMGWLLDGLDSVHGDASSVTIGDRDGEVDWEMVLGSLDDRHTFEERYEVRDEIGRGGMGEVYRVYDRRLSRTLAMKVIRHDAGGVGARGDSTKSHLGRFLEEAQITGQLEHPGIVPVHDLGVDPEGRPYFTMSLVRGTGTFKELIRGVREGRGAVSLERAISILVRVCETVAFAHTKRVIHRDLKPSNVIVGRFGEAYVLDWGLAKLTWEDEQKKDEEVQARLSETRIFSVRDGTAPGMEGSSSLTQAGAVLGTPAYMAPELASGEDSASVVSDVYSVGAILYHLLSGRMPFERPGSENSPFALLVRLQDGPPEPLWSIDPELPAELVAICNKAMSRSPGARYADLLAMAADLRAYLEGRVVRAHRTGVLVEVRKWVARNKALAGSIAAIFVVALAGAWVIRETRAAGEKRVVEEKDRSRLLRQRRDYLENIREALTSLDAGMVANARHALANCPAELRGWEWEHLRHRLHPPQPFYVAGNPTRLAMSPTDDWYVIGGRDGALRVFGLGDTSPRQTMTPSADETEGVDPVRKLVIDPGGEAIYAGHESGTLRGWTVRGWTEKFTRHDQQLGIADIEVHRDLPFLATSAGDQSILFRVSANGAGVLPPMKGERVQLSDNAQLAIHPELKVMAAWGELAGVEIYPVPPQVDGIPIDSIDTSSLASLMIWIGRVVKYLHDSGLWDLIEQFNTTGHALDKDYLPGVSIRVNDLEFSPNGRFLAAVGSGGPLLVWRFSQVDHGVPYSDLYPERLGGGYGDHTALAFSPDSRLIATARYSSIELIELEGARKSEEMKTLQMLHGHENRIVDLAFDRSGGRLVSLDEAGGVLVWNLVDVEAELPTLQNQIVDVDVYVDGSGARAALLSRWGELRVVDLRTRRQIGPGILAPRAQMVGVGFANGGEEVVTVDMRSRLYRWRVADGSRVGKWIGPDNTWRTVAIDEPRGRIALPNGEGGVEIEDLEENNLATIEAPGEVTGLSFDLRNDRLGIVTADGALSVVDLASRREVLACSLGDEPLQDVAFSADGSLVAACGEGRQVHLREVESGDRPLENPLESAARNIVRIRFVSEDRLMAVGEGGLLSIWELDEGRLVMSLQADEFRLTALAATPDGILVLGGDSCIPRVLELAER